MPTADVHEAGAGLEPGAAAPGSPPSPEESGSKARVTAAALGCIARFGLSKTTVDDIAREAGLSRATLYRAFPGGRDEVLSAVRQSELRRYFAELAVRLEDVRDLEELLVVTLSTAADQIARHEALRFLLAHEPEVVVHFVSFRPFDHVLAVAGEFLEPYLAPSLGQVQARRVAEWVTRLVISYLACPRGAAGTSVVSGLGSGHAARSRRAVHDAPFALHPEPIGEERARRLVRNFVMPGIHVLAAKR